MLNLLWSNNLISDRDVFIMISSLKYDNNKLQEL